MKYNSDFFCEVVVFSQSLRSDPCDCVWQTVSQLRRKKINVEIVWLAERKSLKNYISKKRVVKDELGIIHHDIVKILPFERFRFIKDMNTVINLYFILQNKKKQKNRIFWIFEPFPFFPFNFLFKGKKIYDCIDNFSVLSPDINNQEKKLINFTDQIFTCNKTLYLEIRKKTKKAILVPQGFDESIFEIYQNSLKLSLEFKPTLRFIFVGTICARFDFPLLSDVIESHPKCTFTFAGPILKEFQPTKTFDQDVKKLLTFKNVLYLGVKSRDEVAKLLKGSDVGFIPYDSNNLFNQFSLPLKTLEYFYFGLPVFATKTPEMVNLKELVFTFESSTEFKKCVLNLKKNGWPSKKRALQRQFAQSQSWEKKINSMLELISE